MKARDVVITGVGTIAATGAGYAEFTRALDAGEFPLTRLDDARLVAGAPSHAALVPKDATNAWIRPLVARRMSAPSRFGVAAMRAAAVDAGLATPDEPWHADERTAVCFGNAWGSTLYTEKLLQQLEERGPEGISPYLFMETVANAPAGQVALDQRARGPNLTLTQREASDVAALARGAALIESGRAERVLAGTVAEMSSILHVILGRFGALTRESRARPFDLRRDGFIAAEGATVFVLESADVARARGAVVRARIAGWARANDPSASATDWGVGADGLAAALSGRIDLASIERVVSGAAGARRGDALEAQVLLKAFRGAVPPVIAPKAIVGEYGSGFLASALHFATSDVVPKPLATAVPDPALGLVAMGGVTLAPARRTLVTSLASGGPAAWVALARP
ncbi:MAG: beta-ketoacyl synthase N-terminal-like domain-containing protein [Planctomycetota bacterium]